MASTSSRRLRDGAMYDYHYIRGDSVPLGRDREGPRRRALKPNGVSSTQYVSSRCARSARHFRVKFPPSIRPLLMAVVILLLLARFATYRWHVWCSIPSRSRMGYPSNCRYVKPRSITGLDNQLVVKSALEFLSRDTCPEVPTGTTSVRIVDPFKYWIDIQDSLRRTLWDNYMVPEARTIEELLEPVKPYDMDRYRNANYNWRKAFENYKIERSRSAIRFYERYRYAVWLIHDLGSDVGLLGQDLEREADRHPGKVSASVINKHRKAAHRVHSRIGRLVAQLNSSTEALQRKVEELHGGEGDVIRDLKDDIDRTPSNAFIFNMFHSGLRSVKSTHNDVAKRAQQFRERMAQVNVARAKLTSLASKFAVAEGAFAQAKLQSVDRRPQLPRLYLKWYKQSADRCHELYLRMREEITFIGNAIKT